MSKTGPKTEAGLQVVSDHAKQLDHTAWTRNPEAVQAIEIAKRLRNTKHGMYASVPIICKSSSCPYAESCELQRMDLAPFGEKCPMEIAAIEDLFGRYCEDLQINPENPSHHIDAVMVRELVDIDISLIRCDKKMAISADFVIENVVGMTDDAVPISRQELHPIAEYKEKLRASKYKTLNLLNSTRKDKEGSKMTVEYDTSARAAELLKVHNDMKIIDVDEDDAEKEYYERMRKLKSGDVIDIDPVDIDTEE